MSNKRKLGLVSVVLASLVVGILLYRHYTRPWNFDAITDGMTEAQVVELLGEPHSVRDCNWSFLINRNPACAKAYVYQSVFAPIVPHYPVVWFDKAGLVIEKYAYSSP